jgi:hypothetical protein
MDAKIFDQSNRKFVTFYEAFSPSIVPVKIIQQQTRAENERADLIGSHGKPIHLRRWDEETNFQCRINRFFDEVF